MFIVIKRMSLFLAFANERQKDDIKLFLTGVKEILQTSYVRLKNFDILA
jgi:hypothetical protein